MLLATLICVVLGSLVDLLDVTPVVGVLVFMPALVLIDSEAALVLPAVVALAVDSLALNTLPAVVFGVAVVVFAVVVVFIVTLCELVGLVAVVRVDVVVVVAIDRTNAMVVFVLFGSEAVLVLPAVVALAVGSLAFVDSNAHSAPVIF